MRLSALPAQQEVSIFETQERSFGFRSGWERAIKFSEIRAPWHGVSRPSKDQRSRTQLDVRPPDHRRARSRPTANQEKSHSLSPQDSARPYRLCNPMDLKVL